MRRCITTLLILLVGLVGALRAMTIEIDNRGNHLRVEQGDTMEREDGKLVTEVHFAWGNLENNAAAGFHKFNGFIAPENGTCKVVDVHMFDTGGSYESGRDDKVIKDGPAYVAWRASTRGKTDGLTVRIVTVSDTPVHIRVGEWHGIFHIAEGRVVDGSLAASAVEYHPATASVSGG